MIPALSMIVSIYAVARLVLLPFSVPEKPGWLRGVAAVICVGAIGVIMLQLLVIMQAGSSGLGGLPQ